MLELELLIVITEATWVLSFSTTPKLTSLVFFFSWFLLIFRFCCFQFLLVFIILFTFFPVAKGDRIAQLLLEKIITPEVQEVADVDVTERGAGGFGSTKVGALSR